MDNLIESSELIKCCKCDVVIGENIKYKRICKTGRNEGNSYFAHEKKYNDNSGSYCYCKECLSVENEKMRIEYEKREAERLARITNHNRLMEEDYKKELSLSFFKKIGDTENKVINVICVKQHANGFLVKDNDDVSYSFPKGEYSYKVAKAHLFSRPA